jgi:hypothetical protein
MNANCLFQVLISLYDSVYAYRLPKSVIKKTIKFSKPEMEKPENSMTYELYAMDCFTL